MGILIAEVQGMAIIENELVANGLNTMIVDKAEIRRIVTEQNAISGFVPNPMATAETAQALVGACLLARGIKPEDNIFSRGIIEAREES